jgi:hypothetical protein
MQKDECILLDMNDNVIGARACGRVHGRAMLLAQQPAPGHVSINVLRPAAICTASAPRRAAILLG